MRNSVKKRVYPIDKLKQLSLVTDSDSDVTSLALMEKNKTLFTGMRNGKIFRICLNTFKNLGLLNIC